MANLGDTFRRMVEAKGRFRRQLLEMTFDYYKTAFELSVGAMREAAGETPAKPKSDRERAWRWDWGRDANGGPEAPAPAPSGSLPRLLLEGVANEVVVAAFGVENTMANSCVATFRLAPGSDVAQLEKQITFSPAQITLQPGEQAAVQISVAITTSMIVDRSYLGEIEVVGLPASGIPIVVRRREGSTTP